MINDVSKYVQDINGNVYKVIEDHFLRLSPRQNGEERRINEIENDEYHIIAYNNACMIVNKQYDAIDEKWKYNGKHYLASMLNISTKAEIEEHTFKISLLPNHTIMLDDGGQSELKLVKHKGKMYYILIINEMLPRVKAYTLFGEFAQWVGIQHCKPVFCETENKWQ